MKKNIDIAKKIEIIFNKAFDILHTSSISDFLIHIEEDENQDGHPVYYIVGTPRNGTESESRRVATIYSDVTGENVTLNKNGENDVETSSKISIYDSSALADLYAIIPTALTKLSSLIAYDDVVTDENEKQLAVTTYLIGIVHDYYASRGMTDDELRLWQALSGVIDNVGIVA